MHRDFHKERSGLIPSITFTHRGANYHLRSIEDDLQIMLDILQNFSVEFLANSKNSD